MLKTLKNYFNISFQIKKLLNKHGYKSISNRNLLKSLEIILKQIEHHEAYSKAILDSLPHSTWLKDNDGTFLHVNPIYLSNINLKIEDVLGKRVFDIFPKAMAQFYDDIDKEVIQSKKTVFREYQKKDRFFESYKSPVFDRVGNVIGTTGMERDITENKLLYKYLSDERNYLHSLLANLPYNIYFKDTNRRFTKINHAQAKFLGVENPGDAIGKRDEDFFDKDHVSNSKDDEESILNGGLPLIGKIEHIKANKKNYRWVSATKVAIKDEDGAIQGLVGISIDITKQIETESELRLAKANAEEADKLKSAFLANISHEIRTPMNGIIGFSDLLKRQNLSGDERDLYLSHIEKSTRALLAIIEDIIDISKIEAGQLKIHPTPINLPDAINQAYLEIKKELLIFNKSNIQLIAEIPEEYNEFKIVTDEARLKQILFKILHNAVKFTERGSIKYGYSLTSDNEVLFFVTDTGIGIPVDKINIIFERFGQILEHRKMDHPGTGMGLSISYHMIKLMGGNMWVESTEGKGSTFYFNLPLVPTQENTSIKSKSVTKKNRYNWKDKCILIAEDEELNYLYLKELLSLNNPEVVRAKNGAEALQFCKNNTPDLILMDVKMPIMDGYVASGEIKKIKPQIPIIAQTAYALQDEKARSIKAGCDGYISKPLNRDMLFEMIDSHFSSKT